MALSTRLATASSSRSRSPRTSSVADVPTLSAICLSSAIGSYMSQTSRSISPSATLPNAADRRLFSISARRNSAVTIDSDWSMPAIALSATSWSCSRRGRVGAAALERQARARQRRSQIVGDVVADAGQRMDHRFHFVEHAVDDAGEPRERLVDIPVRKPLAQVAGDDALDPLVDLLDASSGHERSARRRPAARSRTPAAGQAPAPADDPGDFPGLVDVASDHQYIAVIKAPCDGPDQWSVGLLVVGPRHPHALHRPHRLARSPGRRAILPASLCPFASKMPANWTPRESCPR